jgi:hypothetical protein
MHLYPNRWILVNKIRIFAGGDILRNYQLSNSMKKLQIPNGYMQLIVSLVLVSNPRSAKCGFEAIKRANPLAKIHPSDL